ncbi:hypothetical protein [Flagellimonas sp.]|uniref:hypothetical protein n=1 Tax=Flagellimonas sp. TaxID=2058762 RepID=UPI003B52EE05
MTIDIELWHGTYKDINYCTSGFGNLLGKDTLSNAKKKGAHNPLDKSFENL